MICAPSRIRLEPKTISVCDRSIAATNEKSYINASPRKKASKKHSKQRLCVHGKGKETVAKSAHFVTVSFFDITLALSFLHSV